MHKSKFKNSNATEITIGDTTYRVGDKVWCGINNPDDESRKITFTEGYVCFGEFGAEIYTCYGFYVGDKEGNQVSEAGLTDNYIIIP